MERAELEVRSTASRSSRSSVTSVTLAAATARAKAEAAQARAAFAKKEIELKLEKARLEATLHALEKEGEAQAAAAEAAVMEAAAASLETTVERPIHLPPLQSAHEHTAEYVREHSEPIDKEPVPASPDLPSLHRSCVGNLCTAAEMLHAFRHGMKLLLSISRNSQTAWVFPQALDGIGTELWFSSYLQSQKEVNMTMIFL
ncbi:hypothetical protein MHYP_G00253020 [Metynnis hypsauchen]